MAYRFTPFVLPMRAPWQGSLFERLPNRLVRQARCRMIRSRFPALIWDNVPEQMSPATRVWLRSAFVPLAQRVFDRTSRRFWLTWLSDDSLNQLKRFILVFDQTGQPIAWAAAGAFEVDGRRCFYGSSAGVDPAWQGSGITSSAARHLFLPALGAAAPRTLYAVVRTGNPLVYSAWQAGQVGRQPIYPALDGREPPAAIAAIAREAADRLGHGDRLDPTTLIMRDCYNDEAAGLWSKRPPCDDDTVGRWFNDNLTAHDGVMMVVPFDPAATFAQESMRLVQKRLGLNTGRSSRRASAA
ncbi:hypothetical protein [Salinisphaera japonica]|uniref:N-acetyltransferase domain-containing protein n=1 Tax=Salinisphaera japonica YTM-1 TaxID=1209778 RepID=A0A423PRC4_9GAMM|nr:hypothetical protein [Salinisphaera japonica]ROO28140.1 hypothetical protein SAJA_08235 [Salinisphaera japonica YTM-1]